MFGAEKGWARSRQRWVGFVFGFAGTAALLFTAWSYGLPPDSVDQVSKTSSDLRAIYEALDVYKAERGQFPSAEEGLAILVPGYLPRLPRDAWGHIYLYQPGFGAVPPDVVSYGADGRAGGGGAAADVSARFGVVESPPSSPFVPEPWRTALVDMSYFLLPMIGFVNGGRRAWAAGLLAGVAAPYAIAFGGTALIASDGVAIACGLIAAILLLGGLGTLARVRYAVIATFAAVVLATGTLLLFPGI